MRFSVTCALALALALARPASASPAPAVALREAASLATAGCAGFESFSVGGATFLAAANFWDGSSHDMSADSVIYRATAAAAAGGALALEEVQRVPGKGAHGADFFESPRGERFLVIPSYYGCGSARGAADQAPDACRSTLVLRHDAAEGRFVEHQRLATSGPAQTDHFVTRGGATLLVVGENFADLVTVFALNAATGLFERGQSLAVPGSGAVAIFEMRDEVILTAASYFDPESGWSTRSLVFAADATVEPLDFVERQRIPTFGAHDADVAIAAGQLFLFLSEDRSEGSSQIHSSLMTWNGGSEGWEVIQKLPGDGAHAAEIFQGPDGAAYVFVANFGDRLNRRMASRSTLWRQPRLGAPFEQVADVASQGATDAEHFVLNGRHFVALSNEGDIGSRLHQTSVVYELIVEAVEEGGASAEDGDGEEGGASAGGGNEL